MSCEDKTPGLLASTGGSQPRLCSLKWPKSLSLATSSLRGPSSTSVFTRRGQAQTSQPPLTPRPGHEALSKEMR